MFGSAVPVLRTARSEDEGYRLKQVDASAAFGSTELVVANGIDASAKVTGGWATAIADQLPQTDSPLRLRAAIDSAEKTLDVDELAGVQGDGFVHGLMLGALDALYELDSENQIEVAEFTEADDVFLLVSTDPGFASLPYEAALREFLGLKPLTKKSFLQLDLLARKRAFTVAGASRTSIVRTVQRELARQVARGEDLRNFRDRVVPRLERAGWTPKNPSHVENVFRTNVMKTYSAGRVEHSMKPAVLKARPYWLWRGVQDGPPRQRESHRKAHGYSMKATNPEWVKVYPPAGFMCRCRIVAVSEKRAGKIVESILAAVSPLRLVDKGFSAGVPALIG
jgi:SPP1 gp7 family putative phage head morphogenesis protein